MLLQCYSPIPHAHWMNFKCSLLLFSSHKPPLCYVKWIHMAWSFGPWFQQKISPVFVILKCAKQMTHMWTIVRINDAICLRQRQWAKENAKKWKECCCIQYDWLLHLLACNELSTRFYLMFNQHEFDVMWFAANANTPASEQTNMQACIVHCIHGSHIQTNECVIIEPIGVWFLFWFNSWKVNQAVSG